MPVAAAEPATPIGACLAAHGAALAGLVAAMAETRLDDQQMSLSLHGLLARHEADLRGALRAMAAGRRG